MDGDTLAILVGFGILGFYALITVVLRRNRAWYRKHPGAEERFADIDEELHHKGL